MGYSFREESTGHLRADSFPGRFRCNTDPLGLALEFQSWKAGVVWIDPDVVVPSSKVPSIIRR